MTTVVISQPMYFPWAGFIAQMALADVYVWLDDVQFSKGSFTNRIQVRGEAGRSWMTIPLGGGGTFQRIDRLTAANEKWRSSHRAILRHQYKQAPYLGDALAIYDAALMADGLSNVLISSCEGPANYLGVLPSRIVRTSSLDIVGESSARVLSIVHAVGGSRYLTGHGAARYLDCEAFEKAGVAVEFMDYEPLPWQNHRVPFDPYVTILELIACGGPHSAPCLNPKTMGWREFMARRSPVGV